MKVLGIDVGGSGIKGNIVDLSTGELLDERHRIPTPQPATPKAVAKTVAQLAKHFNWKGPIGCGFPAAMQHGVAQTASNIDKKWIGVSAEKLFAHATGCPVTVINDADAAGLAEVAFGGGKGKKGLVLLLTLGTGIGSALILDGKLVPNTELGHLKFKGGIAEHYCADSIRKKEDLSWSKWGGRVDEYLHHLKRLFYPDAFIIGGGVSKKWDKFSEHLTVDVPLFPAELLNHAGIIGAAMGAKALASVK
ncbi:MAG: ROK family protein [Bacteroidota bacterium]